jgi:hypothetical protein
MTGTFVGTAKFATRGHGKGAGSPAPLIRLCLVDYAGISSTILPIPLPSCIRWRADGHISMWGVRSRIAANRLVAGARKRFESARRLSLAKSDGQSRRRVIARRGSQQPFRVGGTGGNRVPGGLHVADGCGTTSRRPLEYAYVGDCKHGTVVIVMSHRGKSRAGATTTSRAIRCLGLLDDPIEARRSQTGAERTRFWWKRTAD